MRLLRGLLLTTLLLLAACSSAPKETATVRPAPKFLRGGRVLVDAHNCYPYHGQWADRIDRALKTGVPLAIEQDLDWYADASGKSWSLVAHEPPFTGHEPVMREYFFEKIRPIVEDALKNGDTTDWPLITLNLDFKTEEPEHLAAIWQLLGEYEKWLTTAERLEDPTRVAPLDVKPVLVLTGESEAQQRVFFDNVPAGSRLRVFGAVHVKRAPEGSTEEHTWKYNVSTPPAELISGGDNYRRWWNNSWHFVEEGGATRAAEWTTRDEQRLLSLVSHAHGMNLWIRFYTLNGHDPKDQSNGWGAGYNFGSRERVEERWRAAMRARVDFIATDQYEDLSATMRGMRTSSDH